MTATVLNFEDYRLHAFQRHGSRLPWFVLAEVCKVLELTDVEVASRRLDDDEKSWSVQYTDQGRRMLTVSLSGLTRLAATSRKPIAKRFNKWLHSEVVVSLYLTGEYKGDTAPLEDLVGTFQPLLDLPEPEKRNNVVPLQPPSPRWPASISKDREKYLDDLIAEHREDPGPQTVNFDADVDVPEPNPLIGLRSPPALWGRPLVKFNAHHLRRDDGHSCMCQCHVHEDGALAEFWIHCEPMRPTRMRERFLLMNTPQEFLIRFDWEVPALAAHTLLNLERECANSPLTEQQAEAVLTFLTSGV